MATNERGKKRCFDEAKNPPQFFKVVFSPVDRGIKIPFTFMKKYGESLEKDHVWLKVPTGASWRVELLRTDFGTWLFKGWKDFAEYYSIEKWYFLVFRYDGKSLFHVIIFDPSASEIEYPVEAKKDDHGVKQESDDEDDQERKHSVSMNKRKNNVNLPHKIIKREGRFERVPNNEAVIDKDNYISYRRAEAFKSKNPFFIRFMQPSYITNTCTLSFQLSFAKKYLPKAKRFRLDLRVPGRAETWNVLCPVSTSNAKMRRGWRNFVVDNNLVIGDVCAFELIKGTQMFNITIYRRN